MTEPPRPARRRVDESAADLGSLIEMGVVEPQPEPPPPPSTSPFLEPDLPPPDDDAA